MVDRCVERMGPEDIIAVSDAGNGSGSGSPVRPSVPACSSASARRLVESATLFLIQRSRQARSDMVTKPKSSA